MAWVLEVAPPSFLTSLIHEVYLSFPILLLLTLIFDLLSRHSPFRQHKTKDKHEIDRMTLTMVSVRVAVKVHSAAINRQLLVLSSQRALEPAILSLS